jgi:hypothetical protein
LCAGPRCRTRSTEMFEYLGGDHNVGYGDPTPWATKFMFMTYDILRSTIYT